uniref:Uncharacterized protein n=1 Tax=Glossina austeni TaxID=7395 RepID=A0A1A9VXZ7_GLOAU
MKSFCIFVLSMLQIRLLNEDLQRKANEELNEGPSRKHALRILFHNVFHTFSQYGPLEYLLKANRGENGSFAEIIDEWVKRLDKYRGYFNRSTQCGKDEKLRIED